MNLVLLPGMDGTGELFKPFLEAANGAVKCTVVQYPTNIVVESTEYLNTIKGLLLSQSTDYIVVAESFSGPFAIQLGSDHQLPKGMRGIVLCSTFANCPVHPALHPFTWLLGPVAMRLPVPRWIIRTFLLGRNSNERLVDLVVSTIKSVGGDVLWSRLSILLRCDLRKEAGSLKVPCVAFLAEKDRLVSRASQRALAEAVGERNVTRINGPHLLMQARPREVWDAIRDFASRLKK